MLARPLALALLAPLLVAWNAGGSGSGTWTGIDGPVTVPLSAVVRADDTVRVVFSLPAGAGGDALVFVTVSRGRLGMMTRLPAPGVEVAFREYGPDGRVRAGADAAASGEVTLAPEGGRWVASVDASWRGSSARSLHGARIVFSDGDLPSGVSAGGEVTAYGGGCDATAAPDPEPEAATGCDGDDWSDDDGWSDDGSDDTWGGGWDAGGDSGGGCEGDDVGSSGGGCEGDDVGGAGDAASSCEGDAIASSGAPRRSPTVVRLINQLPWLMVLFGIRLAQRRRRRRRG